MGCAVADVPIHAQPDQGAALEPWVGDWQQEPEYGVFDKELDRFPTKFDGNHRTGCGLRDSQDRFPHLISEGFQGGHNSSRYWDHIHYVKEARDSQGTPDSRE